MTIESRKPPLTGQPGRMLSRRLRRTLLVLPGLTTLAGCSAQGGGSTGEVAVVGGAAAVVLLGATAVVVRRVTARPLERARDLAARNLSQLLDERAGLLEERGRLLAERDAQQARLHSQLGEGRRQAHEHDELQRQYEELQRRQRELADQWAELTAAHGGAVERLAELDQEHELLLAERDGLAKERDELQGSVDATFVNLAMRTLTLVERQLVLIEALEGREADAGQLESLFRLDHLATRMRRNSENMLLLAGLENSQRSRKTVSLLDVVRAAVSEIERYERVKLGFLAAVRLTGAVADDTSHLLAELLENATAFSPPQEQVEIGGWLLDNGEVMISVTDRGIGLPPDRLRAINEQLAEPTPADRSERRDALLAGALTGRSMGLFVVARLAARHGLRVQLRENGQGGGISAMLVLPREALHQDGFSSEDLDDQRRAERSVAADAAKVRAAAVAAAPAPAPAAAVAAAPVAPEAVSGPVASPPVPAASAVAEGELPALPRRRPAHAAAAPEAVPEVAPEVVEPPIAEPAEPAEPAAAHEAPDLDQPTTQLTVRQLRADLGQTTSHGLPRRVPRGNGLPGTGEAPTSGLRRVAPAASSPYERTPGEPAAEPAAGQGAVERPRTSAEELRRRLGGFQSGLRRAARETAGAAEGAEEQDR
ncbi:ATP-binding protein [Kitasatospora sp. NPDC006697]|uniref:ATP-binding protein n=1 Tax=Kitasatospora sp. NPDC006697 TaxID=3364020 RepID=UPI0036D1739E